MGLNFRLAIALALQSSVFYNLKVKFFTERPARVSVLAFNDCWSCLTFISASTVRRSIGRSNLHNHKEKQFATDRS